MKTAQEKTIIAVVLVAVVAFILLGPPLAEGVRRSLESAGYPACAFRAVLQKPCPLCGGTNAFAAAFRGDLAGAWRANPFALLFLATLIATVPGLLFALVGPGSIKPWLESRIFRTVAIGWGLFLALVLVLSWIARL